jgi:hypothetical protein
MYLYVIGDGRDFKIGISKDVASRLSVLQVGNPQKLYVVFVGGKHTEMIARSMEKWMHKHLEEYSVRGEWFHVSYLTILAALEELYGFLDCFGITNNAVMQIREIESAYLLPYMIEMAEEEIDQ